MHKNLATRMLSGGEFKLLLNQILPQLAPRFSCKMPLRRKRLEILPASLHPSLHLHP
jgi:hypothetical protein